LGILPLLIGFRKDPTMAFPPNYNQERRSREAAKQRKAQEKQMKRQEASAQRKHETEIEPAAPDADGPKKDI
jgi:hypothetical protein